MKKRFFLRSLLLEKLALLCSLLAIFALAGYSGTQSAQDGAGTENTGTEEKADTAFIDIVRYGKKCGRRSFIWTEF